MGDTFRLKTAAGLFLSQETVDDSARLHAARVDVEQQQFSVGPFADVSLLQLQHLHVLVKDLALSLSNFNRERCSVWLELTRHTPVVPMRSFSLRRDEVYDHAIRFVRWVGIKAASPC